MCTTRRHQPIPYQSPPHSTAQHGTAQLMLIWAVGGCSGASVYCEPPCRRRPHIECHRCQCRCRRQLQPGRPFDNRATHPGKEPIPSSRHLHPGEYGFAAESPRVLPITTVVIQPLGAFRHPVEPQPALAQIITTSLPYTGAILLGRYKQRRLPAPSYLDHHCRRPRHASEPWSLLLQSSTPAWSQQGYRRSARRGKRKEGAERHPVDLAQTLGGLHPAGLRWPI